MNNYIYILSLINNKLFTINDVKDLFNEDFSIKVLKIDNNFIENNILWQIVKNENSNYLILESISKYNDIELSIQILKNKNCSFKSIKNILKNFKFKEEILRIILVHPKTSKRIKNILNFFNKRIDDFSERDLKIYIFLKIKEMEKLIYESDVININQSNQVVAKIVKNLLFKKSKNLEIKNLILKILYENGYLLYE